MIMTSDSLARCFKDQRIEVSALAFTGMLGALQFPESLDRLEKRTLEVAGRLRTRNGKPNQSGISQHLHLLGILFAHAPHELGNHRHADSVQLLRPDSSVCEKSLHVRLGTQLGVLSTRCGSRGTKAAGQLRGLLAHM